MSLAHLTMPTRAVERTARFLEQALGYHRDPPPANSPVETVWLATGGGQQMHIVYVEGFEVSPFEGEFGRHIAIFHPVAHDQVAGLSCKKHAAAGRFEESCNLAMPGFPPLRSNAAGRFGR